jgi:error-prone DNA polymerase
LLQKRQRVQFAGLVVVHQSPPTAKGHHFICLEDEEEMVNVIVQPKVYDQHHQLLHTAHLLMVDGVVQQTGGVTSVLARRLRAFNLG